MRYSVFVRATVISILFAFAVQPSWASEQEKKSIEKLYADWRVAVEQADIPAYVESLATDVRLLPPGAEPIIGSAGYGKFLEPVFASATYKIEVNQYPLIEVVGDFAVVEYIYTIHLSLKDPDSAISEPGALTASRTRARYFDVLRKQDDGQWRIWRHTWQQLSDQ